MPLTRAPGSSPRDRRDQRVAAAAVATPGLAQVAIVGGALEQPRERELLDRRGAEVVEHLRLEHRVDQRRRAAPASRGAARARASLRPCPGTRRGRARDPAALRAARGRSGTRRRSRPRSRGRRRAPSAISAPRRAGESATPVGHWWAGVVKHDRRVERVDVDAVLVDGHAAGRPGPRRRAPRGAAAGPGPRRRSRACRAAASARASSASPWVAPAQTTIASGSATTPRTRRRYAASAAAQLGRAARVRVGERARGRRAQHVAQRAATTARAGTRRGRATPGKKSNCSARARRLRRDAVARAAPSPRRYVPAPRRETR